MKGRVLPWFILVVVLISVLVDLPSIPRVKILGFNFNLNFPLKLGLDLQGGTELILQTDMEKIGVQDRDEALRSAKEVIERRVNLYGVSEAVVQTSKVGDQRRIIVELPGLKDASTAAQLIGKTALLEFKELPATASADTPVDFIQTGLTGADLKKATPTFGGRGNAKSGPEVQITFTDEGAKKFAEITKRNINKPLAIYLDNELISAPIVQQEIIGGNAVINGKFTTDEAKNLAVLLNAGAIPVPIKIIDQRTIGPTLGQESINKSITAGIIGLTIVMVYMALYYGLLGTVADLALIIYALIVLAVFKVSSITLTLAGIAGFILSIGMAVDANILIFERMKEEVRWGKNRPFALQLGFDRAWTSIWASNVSSLITAAILYYFGTSLVKGFAITLAIGVLVSMFTAITITRTLLKFIVRG